MNDFPSTITGVSGAPMAVLDVTLPENHGDFATADGRYFVDADYMLETMHTLLHELAPMAFVMGLDPEVFADSGHVLINLTSAAADDLRNHIAAELAFALPDAERPEPASETPLADWERELLGYNDEPDEG